MASKKDAKTAKAAKPKTAKRDTTAWTVPRQFRLASESLTELDQIAEHLSRESGVKHSRTDAIRYAARQTLKGLGLASDQK